MMDMMRPYALPIAGYLSARMEQLGVEPPTEAVMMRTILGTVIALICGLPIAMYILMGYIMSHNRRDSVLIVGVSGEKDEASPGKTTLFKTLRYYVSNNNTSHNTFLPCVPSMEVNEATFPPPFSQKANRWVDIPGHARIRDAAIDAYIPRARCIIFVLDASTFNSHARKSAALLHDVLVHPAVRINSLPVLVFCNKSDLLLVSSSGNTTTINSNSNNNGPLSVDAVKLRLQAELDRIRSAKAVELKSVRDTTTTNNNNNTKDEHRLGFPNVPFEFDHAFGPVSFGVGSAATRDISSVVNFVRSSFL